MTLELMEVTAVDVPNLRATVIRPNEPDPEEVIVEQVAGVTPVVGELAWVETSRAGWVLLANHKSVGVTPPTADTPELYVRKGATSALTTSVRSGIGFGSAVPTWQTDIGWSASGGTGGNARVTFTTPGWYIVVYQALWVDAVLGRRIVEWQNSAGVVVASTRSEVMGDRDAPTADQPQEQSTDCIFVKRMALNEWIEPYGFQSSGGPLSIQDLPHSNVIIAKFIPDS